MLPFEDHNTADIIAIDMLKQQLPEALALKDKIKHGETINDLDLKHLEGMLHSTQGVLPHIQHHQEYGQLTLELIHLYQEIIEQTLDDELTQKHHPKDDENSKL